MKNDGEHIEAGAVGRGPGPLAALTLIAVSVHLKWDWGKSLGPTAWGLASGWEGLPQALTILLCVGRDLLSHTTSAVTIKDRGN